MAKALGAAEKLRSFLAEFEKDTNLSPSKLQVLETDCNYVQKCIAVLSGGNPDAINELWREIQHLSQFFGGDYAQGKDQQQLIILMDELQGAVLDLIVSLRS